LKERVVEKTLLGNERILVMNLKPWEIREF
jgi:hypothetical protein